MIGVSGAAHGYGAALAELPLSATAVDDVRDAIAVVDGTGDWAQRARMALRAGASALVIARPGTVGDGELAALEALAGRTPIVLDRPRLRADVVADAVAEAVPDAVGPDAGWHVSADAVAVESEIGGVVRDAIGWLRILAGGRLALRAGETLPHGVLAMFEHPASGRAAALTASALIGRGGARLRAHAIGETRIEIDLDAATRDRTVVVTTAEGARRVPRRHESSERLALRRAVDAVVHGNPPADLDEFRHDAYLEALTWG
ncbi:hypothetical protein HWD99_17635 [Microbacterium sp. C5A9]|uniref:hypothetical protein n=1 Tax=Microbacterium sp. C5A9 TaxID=2736663 RepID=UPI001F51C4F6|nr:hypothetical protein [Microbacterium sp. C5A9]MCI1020452.1 hypothetical protein [Microbacterium sp. C5A9]